MRRPRAVWNCAQYASRHHLLVKAMVRYGRVETALQQQPRVVQVHARIDVSPSEGSIANKAPTARESTVLWHADRRDRAIGARLPSRA